ncbi:MAG: phosphohistidine phosphatase [Pseudohongiellaceae bacterium]|jgi:phosphohistidine phosphatase
MIIYLMRHGEAEQQALSDPARELTRKGIMDNRSAIAKLNQHAPEIDRALTSPYQRSRQTCSALRMSYPKLSFEVSRALEPEAGVYDLLDEIEKIDAKQVFLISHNPLISNLLALIVDGTLETNRHMGTSHIACVSMDIVAPGCAELLYTLTP